jgi:hypothetical protein
MDTKLKTLIFSIKNDKQMICKLVSRRRYLINNGLTAEDAARQTLEEYNY